MLNTAYVQPGQPVASFVIVDITIGADDYLRYYAGAARDVVATARDGRKVRFPAGILQRFVSRDGIHGSFRIHFSEQGKFASIERVE